MRLLVVEHLLRLVFGDRQQQLLLAVRESSGTVGSWRSACARDMSSSVVTATPRSRISAAAPSMMRCRVAVPSRVSVLDLRVHFYRRSSGLMSPNITRLAGRTALVTGSTGGLGVAIATALAAEGAFVIVTGRDKRPGRGVVDRHPVRAAARPTFVAADLGAGEHDVRRLADQATAAAGGRIDILVNNAAMLVMPTPTADISERAAAGCVRGQRLRGRSC